MARSARRAGGDPAAGDAGREAAHVCDADAAVDPEFVQPARGDFPRASRAKPPSFASDGAIAEPTTPAWTFVRPAHASPRTAGSARRSVFNGGAAASARRGGFLSPEGTSGAPNAGRVAAARDLFFTGNTVIIDHGMGVVSLLAHLSRDGCQEGDVIAAGPGRRSCRGDGPGHRPTPALGCDGWPALVWTRCRFWLSSDSRHLSSCKQAACYVIAILRLITTRLTCQSTVWWQSNNRLTLQPDARRRQLLAAATAVVRTARLPRRRHLRHRRHRRRRARQPSTSTSPARPKCSSPSPTDFYDRLEIQIAQGGAPPALTAGLPDGRAFLHASFRRWFEFFHTAPAGRHRDAQGGPGDRSPFRPRRRRAPAIRVHPLRRALPPLSGTGDGALDAVRRTSSRTCRWGCSRSS